MLGFVYFSFVLIPCFYNFGGAKLQKKNGITKRFSIFFQKSWLFQKMSHLCTVIIGCDRGSVLIAYYKTTIFILLLQQYCFVDNF